MVKFSEVVTVRIGGCAKCFSVVYTLPCVIDKDLADYLEVFGKPIYPLDSIKLLRIDISGGFNIEGRLGTKTIKFVMPKKLEKMALEKIVKKIEFEKKLSEWMTNKLDIEIE